MTREQECTEALEGIENPKEFIDTAKEYARHSQILPLVKEIFQFLEEVYDKQAPRLTRIGFIENTDKDDPDKIPLISLWACVGDKNPIDRITHFRSALVKISNEDSIYNIKQIVTETLKP